MIIVSGICTCNRCEVGERRVYRMIGRCYNCRAEPILMLYRSGDTAAPLECPNCGVYASVHAQRLATDEEIPAAAEAFERFGLKASREPERAAATAARQEQP